MAGLYLTIPTSFTDTTLPVYKNDPMEAAGTLMLIDPTHPMLSWSAGVPAANSYVPNVFRDKAATLLGTTAGATDHRFSGSSLALTERTAKGGLHGIMSPSSTVSTGMRIELPQSILDYMKANATHDYYMSLWTIDTAVQTAGAVVPAGLHSPAVPHGISPGSGQGPGANETNDPSARLLGKFGDTSTGASSSTGPKLRNAAVENVSGWASQYTAYNTGVNSNSTAFNHGAYGPNGWSGTYGKLGARVFLRSYLEDLTVSGRTYATAHAIDRATFDKEVTLPGGRYYGDTYTAPSTIA